MEVILSVIKTTIFWVGIIHSPVEHAVMVSVATEELQVVKRKFPQQNERIEKLFRANEDFRSLCSDYFLCLKHLKKFKKETAKKKLSIEEYKDVLAALERELSYFMSGSKHRSTGA